LSEEQQVLDILRKTGAILEKGHFKLVSGNHSEGYVHVRLALAHSECASTLSNKLASQFRDDKIDAVVGYTIGGAILAENVARYLGARSVVAELKGTKLILGKGYEIKENENVLVVDDVLRPPSGEPIHQAIEAIRSSTKGIVKGVGVIVDRSTAEYDFGVKTVKLARIDFKVWSPETCPLCRQGVPAVDLSSPDTDPLGLVYSLSDEPDRMALVTMLGKIFEKLEERKLLEEIMSFYRPTFELPGWKYERVAILGSYDTFSIMDHIARIVSGLGFYSITSRVIYEKDTLERKELRPYKYEAMNDFLRKMIHSCQYVIIIYSGAGGQFIETAWCSESHKPTLGLVPLRPLSFLDLKGCEYLFFGKQDTVLFCNGFKGVEQGAELVGGWICDKHKNCPFPSSGLTKMILDLYATSRTMFLVGADELKNFKSPISTFLRNRGVLKTTDIR